MPLTFHHGLLALIERSSSGNGRLTSRFPMNRSTQMQLGAFSVSLAVKDIEASRAFYQKFGFTPFAGDLQRCSSLSSPSSPA